MDENIIITVMLDESVKDLYSYFDTDNKGLYCKAFGGFITKGKVQLREGMILNEIQTPLLAVIKQYIGISKNEKDPVNSTTFEGIKYVLKFLLDQGYKDAEIIFYMDNLSVVNQVSYKIGDYKKVKKLTTKFSNLKTVWTCRENNEIANKLAQEANYNSPTVKAIKIVSKEFKKLLNDKKEKELLINSLNENKEKIKAQARAIKKLESENKLLHRQNQKLQEQKEHLSKEFKKFRKGIQNKPLIDEKSPLNNLIGPDELGSASKPLPSHLSLSNKEDEVFENISI